MSVLVAMERADGSQDSEIHFEGHVIKPKNGVVMIPAEHVLSLLKAGYMHSSLRQEPSGSAIQHCPKCKGII
jgi:hypothetical protein